MLVDCCTNDDDDDDDDDGDDDVNNVVVFFTGSTSRFRRSRSRTQAKVLHWRSTMYRTYVRRCKHVQYVFVVVNSSSSSSSLLLLSEFKV